MKCKTAINTFLQLDNRQAIPLTVQLHMVFCPVCKKEIKSLQSTLTKIQNSTSFEMEHDISNKIMAQIHNVPVNMGADAFPIPAWKWATVGALLLLSMFMMPYSDTLTWLNLYFGHDLQIFIYMIMGFIISIYSILFVVVYFEKVKEMAGYLPGKG